MEQEDEISAAAGLDLLWHDFLMEYYGLEPGRKAKFARFFGQAKVPRRIQTPSLLSARITCHTEPRSNARSSVCFSLSVTCGGRLLEISRHRPYLPLEMIRDWIKP